jgi:hypothetical protein
VKQGCPLGTALYVIAISPLLKQLKEDPSIQVTITSSRQPAVALAYANDVIIKNQDELNRLNNHFYLYKEVTRAKLNQDKMEGVGLELQYTYK